MGESYDFCNYLDHYISTEKMLPDVFHNIRYTYYCEINFDGSIRNKDLENICGKFKYLYDLVFPPFDDYASRNNENGEYLNYWLKKELESQNILSITAQNFYKKLTTNDSSFDNEQHLKDKIHDINTEDLEKMNILYHLNTIFHNIKMTSYDDETKCKSHSTECFQKFTDAIKKCSTDKKDKYCKALKSFKQKYEQLNEDNMFGWCKKEYLSTLPPLEEETKHKAIIKGQAADTSEQEPLQEQRKDQNLETKNDVKEEGQASKYTIEPPFPTTVENHNDNNISIFTIFGIILSISVFSIITYKFTPFGSWINRRLRRNKINWRNVEDEQETKRLLEYNHDPKNMDLRNVRYNVSYNTL
ncbi:PIR protein [Plasmodium vivax]|uniref:VIR protein n=1 Tax=Plasmodium vivax TaxID=5855 RepID=A0A565A5D8_PLAVI|nr:PIR protein [Plasmodium vivax]